MDSHTNELGSSCWRFLRRRAPEDDQLSVSEGLTLPAQRRHGDEAWGAIVSLRSTERTTRSTVTYIHVYEGGVQGFDVYV